MGGYSEHVRLWRHSDLSFHGQLLPPCDQGLGPTDEVLAHCGLRSDLLPDSWHPDACCLNVLTRLVDWLGVLRNQLGACSVRSRHDDALSSGAAYVGLDDDVPHTGMVWRVPRHTSCAMSW